MAKQHRPDLIVLDLEGDRASPEEIHASYERESRTRATPLIMLGRLRRRKSETVTGEYVPKPYHYGPLIRRIEELLDASRSKAAPTC
jgi:DNA-binding response OmpR family regulator